MVHHSSDSLGELRQTVAAIERGGRTLQVRRADLGLVATLHASTLDLILSGGHGVRVVSVDLSDPTNKHFLEELSHGVASRSLHVIEEAIVRSACLVKAMSEPVFDGLRQGRSSEVNLDLQVNEQGQAKSLTANVEGVSAPIVVSDAQVMGAISTQIAQHVGKESLGLEFRANRLSYYGLPREERAAFRHWLASPLDEARLLAQGGYIGAKRAPDEPMRQQLQEVFNEPASEWKSRLWHYYGDRKGRVRLKDLHDYDLSFLVGDPRRRALFEAFLADLAGEVAPWNRQSPAASTQQSPSPPDSITLPEVPVRAGVSPLPGESSSVASARVAAAAATGDATGVAAAAAAGAAAGAAAAVRRYRSLSEGIQAMMQQLATTEVPNRFPVLWAGLTGRHAQADINRALTQLDAKKKYLLCRSLLQEEQLPLQACLGAKLLPARQQSFATFSSSGTFQTGQYPLQEASTPACYPGFFTYAPDVSGLPVVISDFANKLLGGGALGRGFVQEEIMFLECPALFEQMLACGVHNIGRGEFRCNEQTRRPLNGGVDTQEAEEMGKGNPDPIYFSGVRRHIAIRGIYGRQYDSADEAAVMSSVQPSEGPTPFHVLAIAAPKLPPRNPSAQVAAATIQDLIATASAGLTLTNSQLGHTNFVWRTGKLGCGAFNNHYAAAYLAQRYAAAIHQVAKVEFYAYSDSERQECEQLWSQFVRACSTRATWPTPVEASRMISQLLHRQYGPLAS